MENKPEEKKDIAKEKKAEDKGPKEIKTKLLLSTLPEHALSNFQAEIKKRGIKEANLNNLILEALDQVPENWWTEKIESLTPLEYKVKEALTNPQMREKLETLLKDKEQNLNQASQP